MIPVGIDRTGQWCLADPTARPFVTAGARCHLEIPSGRIITPDGPRSFDVVFPVLHGPFGEDGTIQGVFEIAGIPYVGSDVLGSAVGMDKDIAKRLFAEAGLPSADYRVVRAADWALTPGAIVDGVVESLGLPVFVKPARLGSSVGVSKAATHVDVKQALEDALAFGPKAIVEETVAGREIEVAVLEGPRASLPGEIVIEREWYDYDAKYHDSTSRFVAPADLTESETARVRGMAAAAFTALELRGLARVDFFFEQGGRGFLINEVNTMPGFTPISGFPKMWQASGMTYAQLCDELVKLALT